MRKYLRNFGNTYAERRKVNVVGEPPRGMCPLEHYYVFEEKAYKGVPLKNEYLYKFESMVIALLCPTPLYLMMYFDEEIKYYFEKVLKLFITALLWLYRL